MREPTRKKLMLVEDDDETRELELDLLGAEGYQVIALPNGDAVAETAKREAPDLLILDLMLPHKDGMQVLTELGHEPTTANTPVFVVSAYVDRPGVRQSLRSCPQVKRILEKPFEIGDLLESVARELGSST